MTDAQGLTGVARPTIEVGPPRLTYGLTERHSYPELERYELHWGVPLDIGVGCPGPS